MFAMALPSSLFNIGKIPSGSITRTTGTTEKHDTKALSCLTDIGLRLENGRSMRLTQRSDQYETTKPEACVVSDSQALKFEGDLLIHTRTTVWVLT